MPTADRSPGPLLGPSPRLVTGQSPNVEPGKLSETAKHDFLSPAHGNPQRSPGTPWCHPTSTVVKTEFRGPTQRSVPTNPFPPLRVPPLSAFPTPAEFAVVHLLVQSQTCTEYLNAKPCSRYELYLAQCLPDSPTHPAGASGWPGSGPRGC